MKKIVAHMAALLFCAQASAIEDPPYPMTLLITLLKYKLKSIIGVRALKFLKRSGRFVKQE
ncbi:hypothetical protein GCM10007978_24090 [Shewanella hanedai]|uniref:Uncharacterized protein n=1 Tax=Shewanella hanedai TaxID=25 RepID=A0A553JMY3_SHEHA|nr:hypothetical protein [Shewanella hanedai]TRY13825.1 hypothetical protein FN961_12975 [Shewanella hanedai]GGI85602.1 hypothetical protein GCM10007978_24090 [Shewanella hanedai]